MDSTAGSSTDVPDQNLVEVESWINKEVLRCGCALNTRMLGEVPIESWDEECLSEQCVQIIREPRGKPARRAKRDRSVSRSPSPRTKRFFVDSPFCYSNESDACDYEN